MQLTKNEFLESSIPWPTTIYKVFKKISQSI